MYREICIYIYRGLEANNLPTSPGCRNDEKIKQEVKKVYPPSTSTNLPQQKFFVLQPFLGLLMVDSPRHHPV